MTKRERLEVILDNFSNEERIILEALGKKRLFNLMEIEHDNDLLIVMLKNLLPKIKEELQSVEKERKEIRKIKDIEEIEDIEIFITKIGKVTIKMMFLNIFVTCLIFLLI